MVLGIITSIAACPAIIGTVQAVEQGQKQNARQSHRGKKSNLQVTCNDPSRKARDIHGGFIVLRNNKIVNTQKLYATNVNPKSKFNFEDEKDHSEYHSHLFAGYFFPYPGKNWGRRGDGYVSTIADDPPQLNWIYVDKDTYEVKYGLKKDAEGQNVGPWTCSPIDRRLTFDGWEGWTVVEEEEDVWALYFDLEDNGLEGKVGLDKRIMEVELARKEMRMQKGDCILG